MFDARKAAVVVAMTGALAACGGGGGSDPVAAASPAPLVSGKFAGPMEGLRYETASQAGLTDASGEFEYRQGETVRFYVGDILLGEARGAGEMTLFHLAGFEAPPVAATEIRALANRMASFELGTPIERVANLATFLDTIDEDNDAANGVVIPAVMHQIAASRSINFDLTWGEFREHYPFMKLLGDAHDGAAWATIVERPMSNTAFAMDVLYESLGLVPQVYAETLVEIDSNNDGFEDIIDKYSYQPSGLLYEDVRDINADGTYDSGFIYFYNPTGDRIGFLQSAATGETRFTGYTRDDRGFVEKTEYTSYTGAKTNSYFAHNNYGQRLSILVDQGANDSTDEKTTYFYNTKGQLVRVDGDLDYDGSVDTQASYEYDSNGYETRYEFDENMDGTPYELRTYTRNALGQRLTSTHLLGGPGATPLESTFEYNSNNQVSVITNKASTTTRNSYRYDANGHLVERRAEFVNPDSLLQSWAYTRDELGNIVTREEDRNGDGTIDYASTRTYDVHGNRTREDVDTDGDDIVDYVVTVTNQAINRWGPIFDPTNL